MSLTVALQSALTGLRSVQAGIDVISRNVANASTDGYTRKTLPVINRVIDGEGRGVVVGEVQRSVDALLLRDLRRDVGRSEDARVRDFLLGRLEATLGNTGDPGSLNNLVLGVTDGLRLLGSNPDSQVTQNQLLRQAQQLAEGIRMLAGQIQNLRADADRQIEAAVQTANDALYELQRLNGEFARLNAAGASIADLEDQRDTVLRDLSKQIDINVIYRGDGTVAVLTAQGRSLLSGGVSPLQFSPSSSMDSAQAYPDDLSGVMLAGADITDELNECGLHGLFQMRDKALPQAQAQLDEFVARLTSDLTSHGLELFNDAGGSIPTLYTASLPALAGDTEFTPGAAVGGPAGGPVLVGSLLRFSNDPDTIYVVTSVAATIGVRAIHGGGGLQVPLSGGESVEFLPPSIRLQVNPTIAASPFLLREGSVTLEGATLSGGGTITGSAYADTITGTGGSATINAGDGDNTIFANAGTNVVNLGKGSDTVTVAAGASNSTIDGGAGFNRVILSGASTAYTISTAGAVTTISGGPSGTVVLTNVQQVQFGDKTVTLRDTSADTTLARSLLDLFEQPASFANGAMLGMSQTYGNYMNSFLTFQGTQRGNAGDDLNRLSAVTEAVRTRLKNESGVNVDAELALMTQLQNAYSSNARIVQAIREMFDELFGIKS